MGLTVHYRGSLADLSRVEDFEDRVIDFPLYVGKPVTIRQHPKISCARSSLLRQALLTLAARLGDFEWRN